MKKIKKRTVGIIAMIFAVVIAVSIITMFVFFRIPHSVDLNNLQFGDAVDIGDYRYVYIGCDDVKEYRRGLARYNCYRMGYRGEILKTPKAAYQTFALYSAEDYGIKLNSLTAWLMINTISQKGYECNIAEYGFFPDGWVVYAIDTTQTEYQPILSYVADKPVVSLDLTFKECKNLVVSPEIPETVISMASTFECCLALTTAPIIPQTVTWLPSTFSGCISLVTYAQSDESSGSFSGYIIPDGVTDMYATFFNCASLTTAPAIPSSVTDMSGAFRYCASLTQAPEMSKATNVTNMRLAFANCTALTGEIEINANPTEYSDCFGDTICPIIVTGSCSETTKAALAKTAIRGNVSY